MPRKCSVKGCRSGYPPTRLHPGPVMKVPVFGFPPNDPQLKEQWAKQIGRNSEEITTNMGLCARHFRSDVKGVKKNQYFSIPTEPPTLFLDCSDEKTDKRKKKKRRDTTVEQIPCLEDAWVKEEFYNNASQNVITSDQSIKLETEHVVHDNVYNLDKMSSYNISVSEKEKPVSNYISKDINHGNEHSDLIVQSLIEAVQAVFCQFISFNSELKIEGFIYVDIDNEEKKEYVLNKNISRLDTECPLPKKDQDLMRKRETCVNTSSIPGNFEFLSTMKFKESDDEVEVNFITDRNQETKPMTSGFVKMNSCASELNINEPQTLASVFQTQGDKIFHVCEKCQLTFRTLRLFNRHRTIVHPYQKPKVQYHCSTCDKELEDKIDHLKHIRWHSPKYTIHCEICGDWFKTKDTFGRHIKCHDGYRPYICSFCPETFISPRLRQSHEMIHSNDKPFQCGLCDRKYKTNRYLKTHIQTYHKPHSSARHKCGICSQLFVRKTKYNIHMLKHSGLKPHQCETCGKGFYEAFQLNIHKRVHSGEKPYICELCGEGFISSFRLKNHTKLKHLSSNVSERSPDRSRSYTKKLDKRLKCLLCNKTCSSVRYFDFVRHIASHVEPALHQKNRCESCGMHFKTSYILKNHQIIKHFREVKKFECNMCPKRFHLEVYLKKHERKHLGLKPFVCKVCGMRYTQSGNLKTHMRNHTGDMFACEMCGKSYTEKRALVKHKRIVHHIDEV